MQVNVIRGEREQQLSALFKAVTDSQQDVHQVIDARAYIGGDLQLLLQCRAARSKVICMDHCNEAQLELIRSLNPTLPATLIIHVAITA